MTNTRIDAGKQFDFGRTSKNYARFRDIYPRDFYEKIASRGLIQKVLKDFVENPLAYNLSEMCGEDEMAEMAAVCKNLMNELYG